ncbi:MAG: C4-dicarboxylic acid transporter DauA [Deltaproteobacteria bacterium]|nr:C4-dicarboxylic acid transporter DauA [Deltaproteobacteria bacterium]
MKNNLNSFPHSLLKASNIKFKFKLPIGSAFYRSIILGYSIPRFKKDIIAGLTVGVIAMPLAMALAIASGVPPQYGLYTSIIAGIVVALAGGSQVNISGPTAAFVVVLFPIQQAYGIGGLAIATTMAGIIMIGFGIMRIGKIIQMIPYPVIIGFTSGIGVVIATLQIKNFFGLEVDLSGNYIEKVIAITTSLPTLKPGDLFVGLITLLTLIIVQRINRHLPHYLIALLAGSITAFVLGLIFPMTQIATIGNSFTYQINEAIGHGIPSILPEIKWPWEFPGVTGKAIGINYELIRSLLGAAFSIAMLGAIESLLSSVVADGLAGTKHDPDSELVGLGIGNLIVPFIGGIPATAAIARTAASIRSGATSPVASIVHSVFILLAIIMFAGILAHIPMATLSAMLFLVAWNMSESRHFLRIIKAAPRPDVYVLLTCFSLTVFFDMIVSIISGVLLAGVLFIKRMNELTTSKFIFEQELENVRQVPKDTIVYQINGPLFFGAAQKALSVLQAQEDLKFVVIDMLNVHHIDMTGIVAFEFLLNELMRNKVFIVLNRLNPDVLHKLRKAGVRRKNEKLILTKEFDKAFDKINVIQQKT